MSGGKIAALVFVAVIHALLGYALVTGLAMSVVKKATEKLNTFDVEEPPPPPPPEEPPPPPPEAQLQPPPVVSPPPIVRNPNPPPVVIASVPNPPPVFIPTPIAAPPAPPAPPAAAPPAPPRVSKRAGLRGNPGQYFSDDAYPPAAIRAGAQGRVVAALDIGTDGRVSNCVVTSSSGNDDLDSTTCRIAKRSVRFTPALDDGGNPIASKFTLPVTWRLPED